MNSTGRFRKYVAATFLFALVISVLLQPWRDVVGQDDASYAFFSDLIRGGIWKSPDLLLAAAWPQALIGAGFKNLFPFFPALSSYMFATFLIYLLNFSFFSWAAASQFDSRRDGSLWVVALFLFPVTLQYGMAFLTETYVVCFLLLYFVFLKRWLTTHSLVFALTTILVTALIVLQRQTYLIFPSASLFLILTSTDNRSRLKSVLPLFIGLLLALLVYLLVPKTFLQSAFIHAMFEKWGSYPNFAIFGAAFVFRIFQLLLAMGLFLTPLVFVRSWKISVALGLFGIQILVTIGLYALPGDLITAGVLFTDYLPRWVGAVFLSGGVWGVGIASSFICRLTRTQAAIISTHLLIFLSFTAFLDAGDLKYVLPAAMGLCFVGMQFIKFDVLLSLGTKQYFALIGYISIVGFVSVLTNRYYLDTLVARFQVARELEGSGVPAKLISAGYGRDSYLMGELCVQMAKEKIEAMEPELRAEQVAKHLVSTTPRQYEDETIFQYLVKPYIVMGKRMGLAKNRLVGQSDVPVKVVPYTVFGIPNALAVFENKNPRAAWCFR